MASLAYTTVINNGLVIPSIVSFDEEALFRRYGKKQPPELVYEFTRDPGLLHQYYKIRANENNTVLGIANYPDAEAEYDRKGYILVVRIGIFCVGGVRINVKTPRKPELLPVEIGDFRLEKYFPQLNYKQMNYGQISGLALLPEFRGGKITYNILERTIRKSIALSMDILFATCPIIHARLYRKDFVIMKLNDTKIHYDLELPAIPHAEEVKHYLLSIPIDQSFAGNSVSHIPGKVRQLEEI